MPGVRQRLGEGVLLAAAEDDVDAVARRFHGAVQVLPGAHARRGDPRDLAEEQGAGLGRADRGSRADEIGRDRAGENPGPYRISSALRPRLRSEGPIGVSSGT